MGANSTHQRGGGHGEAKDEEKERVLWEKKEQAGGRKEGYREQERDSDVRAVAGSWGGGAEGEGVQQLPPEGVNGCVCCPGT